MFRVFRADAIVARRMEDLRLRSWDLKKVKYKQLENYLSSCRMAKEELI